MTVAQVAFNSRVSRLTMCCKRVRLLLPKRAHWVNTSTGSWKTVGTRNRGPAPVDVGVDFQTCEIFSFGEVKELEIHRVVDVPQGVDVVEAQLHLSGALERIFGFDSVIHILV